MDNLDEQKRLMMLKSTAVRQAMVEVMAENRDEILRRAKAKLTAMGVTVADEELSAQIS